MLHKALYREFRPTTFEQVIGQNHIVQTLQNQIKTNTISHAYLFCGTRGTGKTSCAKIFARAVNCLNPQNGSPCGECDVCKSILSNGNLDILEIDAASNNRVDEIRDLKEKVNYLPSVGKFKVYIIDEVHMLTDSAFNALLKTLEEPPNHIIFVLATTEPQKLPATILSRCMRFDFKLVSNQNLVELLKNVFEKTNTTFEPECLPIIAKAGRGSVRDTLSIAEMCKSFANGRLTVGSVMDCLGLTDQKVMSSLADAIVEQNGAKVLDIVENLYAQGKNISVLMSDLSDYFQTLLAISLGSEVGKTLPQEVVDDYAALAKKTTNKYLLDCLQKLCVAESQIKFCANEKVFAQTTLLSMFFGDNLEIAVLKQKVAQLEKLLPNAASNVAAPQSEGLPSTQLTDNQPTISANELFGKFVGYVRQSGEYRLLAGLDDVAEVKLNGSKLTIVCNGQICKMLVDEHRQFVADYLQKQGLQSNFDCVVKQNKELEKQKMLRDLFGEKLKIV